MEDNRYGMSVGVLEGSTLEYHTPSSFAREALFCCYLTGDYLCGNQYCIDRESFEFLQLMYILDGALEVSSRGTTVTAGPNTIIMLDCRQPHRYWCPEHVHFQWLHFTGNASDAYAEYLFRNFGLVFSGPHIKPLQAAFQDILTTMRGVQNEHLMSARFHTILGELAAPQQLSATQNAAIRPALAYISKNSEREVTVEQLAAACGLSPCHFIRVFKKHTGNTPHEYLLHYRLGQAKELLLRTAMSIEEIGERCGFNSASHFVRAFRQSNAMTPLQFRKAGF